MTRRYFAVEFHPNGRSHTYHFDGDEALAAGDEVKVADRDDPTAWKRVTVVGDAQKPTFDTKAILGRAPA